jgi:hypothetical protein
MLAQPVIGAVASRAFRLTPGGLALRRGRVMWCARGERCVRQNRLLFDDLPIGMTLPLSTTGMGRR